MVFSTQETVNVARWALAHVDLLPPGVRPYLILTFTALLHRLTPR